MAQPERYVDEEGNPLGRSTVQGDFDKDSLTGKATDFTKKHESAVNDERYRQEEAANEAQYVQEELVRDALEEEAVAQIQELQRRKRVQLAARSEQLAGKKALRGAGTVARWAGLGLAFTLYLWQLAFGLISLIGIGVQATLSYMLNETLIGRILTKVTSVIGFDLEGMFPADKFGLAFWAVAAMIALCTMVGFYLWFVLMSTPVIDTPLMFLATSLTLALSILPVSNLLPWIPLWVLLVNIRGTAFYAKDLFSASRKLRVRT